MSPPFRQRPRPRALDLVPGGDRRAWGPRTPADCSPVRAPQMRAQSPSFDRLQGHLPPHTTFPPIRPYSLSQKFAAHIPGPPAFGKLPGRQTERIVDAPRGSREGGGSMRGGCAGSGSGASSSGPSSSSLSPYPGLKSIRASVRRAVVGDVCVGGVGATCMYGTEKSTRKAVSRVTGMLPMARSGPALCRQPARVRWRETFTEGGMRTDG